MSISWATNLLHFHRNKVFKCKFCILTLFGLATVLATFQNIGRILYESSGHPVHSLVQVIEICLKSVFQHDYFCHLK
jgi:hypothetical protein